MSYSNKKFSSVFCKLVLKEIELLPGKQKESALPENLADGNVKKKGKTESI